MSKITSGVGGTVFSGAEAVSIYQATTLKVALSMYAKTGMKVNRAYTPKNMLATASRITGKTYKGKGGQYFQAVHDLELFIEQQKQKVEIEVV